MNIFRESFFLIIEIIFSIFIILYGYYIWDNFDQSSYNIAKYYDNTKEVQIAYDINLDSNSVVSIHNVSDKLNNKEIYLKINKENKLEDVVLDINQRHYKLDDLYIVEDDLYNYYLIDNASLSGYETRVYFIDFFENKNLVDFDFVVEI